MISYFEINTQFMTNPNTVYPVKIEYGWNFSISDLKMILKSGLEKIFLNLPHSSFDQKYKFSKKNDMVCEWRISPKKNLVAYLPYFLK